MKVGIARKLITTYLVIIVVTVMSGTFCLYVLGANLRSNGEMRYIVLPSIEHIKEMKTLMQEVKKLTNTWVYISNNKDQERLKNILKSEYPTLNNNLIANITKWKSTEELALFDKINANNRTVIDSASKITALLSKPEYYTDDALVDHAAELNTYVSKLIAVNEKFYKELIETKEGNLIMQQNGIGRLLYSLYVIVVLSIVVVILVGYFSLRYSRRNIVEPLLKVNKRMLDMAIGKVEPMDDVSRTDEIGQMHNAMSKMIAGIIQKMTFAEQLGRGKYGSDFTLLSDKDKLGIALLTMRDDLKRSNEELVEQDRRLQDAQKLARIGNFLYDLEADEFQSSPTLDDILGIDKTFSKFNIKWRDHILPEFHDLVTERAIRAIKAKEKFTVSYIVKRHSDGRECWVKVIGEYNYNSMGRAVSMFGTMQDVTESKMLEIELSDSYKMSREQNSRLLNFSYIVSHNLRMHTVNIHGVLTLLEEAESDEERKEFMGFLKISSTQLDETLHQLNEVVAMKNALNMQLTPIVLKHTIDRTIDLLKNSITEKNAEIINNVPEDLVINYSAVYMDSIVLNFLSNGIKYSRPDVQPIVTISCYKENPKADKSMWILEISDNGLGIDLEKNKDKVFGMYKTFHGNKDAKGLGLFMTKYQVEAMDGKIEVESKVNSGTTFKVYIK